MAILLFLMVLGSDRFQTDLEEHGVFVTPQHVARSADDTLLLSNAEESKLLLFDGTGRFLKQTGRPGSGPGEYQRINGIAWVDKPGYFLVHDSGNSRITALSKDLDVVKEWQLKEFMNRPVQMTGEHIFILRDNNGDIGATPHVLQVNYHTQAKAIPYELPPLEVQYGVHFEEAGYSVFRSFEWDPKLHFAIGKDFFVTTFNDFSKTKPHFFLHDWSGQNPNKLKVAVGLAATPFNEEAIEEPISVYERIAPMIKKHLSIPKLWPAIVGMRVDGERVYVFGPASPSGEHPFEVYGTTGALKGKQITRGTVATIPNLIHKGAAYGCELKDENVVFVKWKL